MTETKVKWHKRLAKIQKFCKSKSRADTSHWTDIDYDIYYWYLDYLELYKRQAELLKRV